MKAFKIVEIESDNIEKAMALVKRVFLESDAQDYSEEGIQEVMEDMIENSEFKNSLSKLYPIEWTR